MLAIDKAYVLQSKRTTEQRSRRL